jgi:dephospho-CoA kinase
MRVVGLTGGIGTGKSTVAGFLRESGVPVIDADQVARRVVEPGSPTLAALVEAFAPDTILDAAGSLDRGAMRARIAADGSAKQTLDRITHPAIGAAIMADLADLAQGGASVAVVEAALMVETGSYRRYSALLVVTCTPERQLQRVMRRDGSTEAEARAFIARQLPMADKEAPATCVVRNDGSLADLERAAAAAWDVVAAGATPITR